MKLTTIIILSVCLHSSANGLAQNTITFSGKEVSLEYVFSAIKKQTSYRFFFNTTIIQHASKITIEVKNAPIEQVMNLALKDQSLTFAIKGRTIFIMKKPEEEKSSSQVAPVSGDPVTVRGKILDENGAPAQGVNVTVRGTNKGTTTNLKGEFELRDVHEGAVLLISSVGYDRQEILVKNKTVITTQLRVAVGNLDETVVIAYGTTTRRFSTGNVSSVKASDIEKQPVQNPLLALQGRVPGLVVTQNTGVPGGGVTVRIQGQNSIAYGNDPLYVIDGVPYFNQLPSTDIDAVLGGGNPLNYINPNDIESIEVLKDADATSVYGSRAANGAILITTKKGKAGQMKLDLNLQTGWGQVAHKWDMLNTRQYLDMRYEALRNDGINLQTQSNTNAKYYDLKVWDTTRYTDWQDELIGGKAQYTNFSASVSGGSANVQFLVSGNYHKENTVFPGNFNDRKGSLHFSINGNSPNQKLRLQFSGNYMQDENRLPDIDLTRLAVQLEPVAPALYNADGSLNWAPNAAGNSTWTNPLSNLLIKYKNKTSNLVSNLVLSYQLAPGLYIKNSLGYTKLLTTDYRGLPANSIMPEKRATTQRGSDFGNRELNSWIAEPQLTYTKALGKGKLDLLAGGTVQQSNSQAGNISSYGYNSDEVMENLSAATTITAGQQYIVQYKYNAVFGRANFNWQEKYILNLTARRDGTSRFGSKSQFHNFGSAGAAWLFSNESWMQNQHFLSFGKIRGSYGSTGSDQIPDYAFMSLYNFLGVPGLPYQNSTGIYATGIPNPYLEWEETRKLQAGIDLGFLQDRIVTNITYSRNRSSNQLLAYQLPLITGVYGFSRNFPAVVQNTTWEFLVSARIIQNKDLNWTSQINLTIPGNKIVSFPNYETSMYSSGTGDVIVGQPLGIKKTYQDLGVDPSTGLYLVADKDGNPVPSASFPADYVTFINLMPRYYGGVQNNIAYKGFELDFLFQFVKQLGNNFSYRNGARTPGFFAATRSNQPVTVLDRWQKPGDIVSVAKYTSTKTYDQGSNSYADASYIRLKNLSLAYQLPASWQKAARLMNCKLYVQGQNLLTITNWEGLDPETQSVSSLPPLRVWTVGVQVGF